MQAQGPTQLPFPPWADQLHRVPVVADEIRVAVSVVAVIFARLDPTIRVEVLATKVVSLPTR